MTLSVEIAVFIALVLVLAGGVNGVAGFGFAVVGTLALATVLDPATAVVLMLIPMLGVNISLVRDLTYAELRDCGHRFLPLIAATLIGTILGMIFLDRIPSNPLRFILGLIAIGFVVTRQSVVPIGTVDRAKEVCFVESNAGMLGVGSISGVLFGATNVGVQLVAYLKSCNLQHRVFIGMVALLFVGINAIRVGLAGVLGLYPDGVVVLASVLAVLPVLGGVLVGKQFRRGLPAKHREFLVLGLLALIGIRLLTDSIGVL